MAINININKNTNTNKNDINKNKHTPNPVKESLNNPKDDRKKYNKPTIITKLITLIFFFILGFSLRYLLNIFFGVPVETETVDSDKSNSKFKKINLDTNGDNSTETKSKNADISIKSDNMWSNTINFIKEHPYSIASGLLLVVGIIIYLYFSNGSTPPGPAGNILPQPSSTTTLPIDSTNTQNNASLNIENTPTTNSNPEQENLVEEIIQNTETPKFNSILEEKNNSFLKKFEKK